jgi:hypothetical protein
MKQHQTEMAGIAIVMEDLATKGFIVVPTTHNAPDVDLFASSPDLSRVIAVQVKARGDRKGTDWPLKTGKAAIGWKPPRSAHYLWAFVDVPDREIIYVPSEKLRPGRYPSKGKKPGEWVDVVEEDIRAFVGKGP